MVGVHIFTTSNFFSSLNKIQKADQTGWWKPSIWSASVGIFSLFMTCFFSSPGAHYVPLLPWLTTSNLHFHLPFVSGRPWATSWFSENCDALSNLSGFMTFPLLCFCADDWADDCLHKFLFIDGEVECLISSDLWPHSDSPSQLTPADQT